MKWLLVPALLSVFAAGCGGVRYPRTYVLDLSTRTPATPAQSASARPLAVRDFACPDYLCDGRIVYRPTRTEVGYYEYHRWATTLRHMITEGVAGRIRVHGVFAPVEWSQRGDAPYILSGAIERLEEVDDGRDVRAVVELSAQLVDARTQKVLWRRSEVASEPVADRDVAGVVVSLSEATRRAIGALVTSLETDTAPVTNQ